MVTKPAARVRKGGLSGERALVRGGECPREGGEHLKNEAALKLMKLECVAMRSLNVACPCMTDAKLQQ